MNDRRLVILLLGAVAILAVVGSIGLSAVAKDNQAVTNLAFSSVGALAGLLAPRGELQSGEELNKAARSLADEFKKQAGSA